MLFFRLLNLQISFIKQKIKKSDNLLCIILKQGFTKKQVSWEGAIFIN